VVNNDTLQKKTIDNAVGVAGKTVLFESTYIALPIDALRRSVFHINSRRQIAFAIGNDSLIRAELTNHLKIFRRAQCEAVEAEHCSSIVG
jgi:hypothetical protein